MIPIFGEPCLVTVPLVVVVALELALLSFLYLFLRCLGVGSVSSAGCHGIGFLLRKCSVSSNGDDNNEINMI